MEYIHTCYVQGYDIGQIVQSHFNQQLKRPFQTADVVRWIQCAFPWVSTPGFLDSVLLALPPEWSSSHLFFQQLLKSVDTQQPESAQSDITNWIFAFVWHDKKELCQLRTAIVLNDESRFKTVLHLQQHNSTELSTSSSSLSSLSLSSLLSLVKLTNVNMVQMLIDHCTFVDVSIDWSLLENVVLETIRDENVPLLQQWLRWPGIVLIHTQLVHAALSYGSVNCLKCLWPAGDPTRNVREA